jgi:fluoride ion exporter CrcB/FEX
LTEFSGLQQRRGSGKEVAENERFGVVDSSFPADTDSGQNSGLDSGEDDIPAAVKRPAPLYIGLATGFCGSFTTCSGFMMDIFLALSDSPFTSADNTTEAPRHGVGRDIMAILAVTFLTISACLSALKLGAHVAILVDRLDLRWRRVPPLKYLDRAMIALAWGSWAGAVLLALFPPDRPGGPAGVSSWDRETWRPVLFSLVLAPLGCLLRFYVSIKLNTIFPAFPLGTFTVNVAGTALFGMAWDLQHASAVGIAGSLVSCQLLQGVMGGFCGCLTTVSTWATELSSLRRTHAYIYGSTSVALSLAALVVIAGTMKWTVGWSDPVCAAA